MIAILLVALAVPVTLVILGLRSMTAQPPESAPEVEGLRSSLESAAEKHFPAPETLGGSRRFTLKETSEGQASLLEKAAASAGGGAITSRLEDGSVRLLIQIPPEASENFEKTYLGSLSASASPDESQPATGLYEVVILPP